jgi:aspartate aminotransferase
MAEAHRPRVTEIPTSASIELARVAAEMRRSHPNLIDLTTGEPDFETPTHVKAEAIRAIQEGKTRYTAVGGIAELRQAIARKFETENGLRYGLDEICVSNGVKSVIFTALLATIAPGDEVLIIAPYWVSYPHMVRLAGGEPVVVHTDRANGFHLDPMVLRNAMTPRTRWIIINSPSNPAGVIYSQEELRQFGDIVGNNSRIMILSDEIYEDFYYEEKPVSVAAALPYLRDRMLTVNGVSKSFGMTGWRIGYAGGPSALIEPMVRTISHTMANASSISQWAASAALDGQKSPARQQRAIYKERRDRVVELLAGIGGLKCERPQGAFYVFVGCEQLMGRRSSRGVTIDSDVVLSYELLLTEQVALVFGSGFGTSAHIRLCLTQSVEKLSEACFRLERFCKSLS